MQKVICLFRGDKAFDYDDFKNLLKDHLQMIIQQIDPLKLSYTITLQNPPGISVIPFRKSKIAVVSVYFEGEKDFGLLEKLDGFWGSYEVSEALPVSYEKTWNDGEQTPGVCLLTLFRQKKNICRFKNK